MGARFCRKVTDGFTRTLLRNHLIRTSCETYNMYLMINRNNRPDNSWSKVFCAFKNIKNVYSASDLRGSTNIHHVNDQVVHIAPDFEAPRALPRHTSSK